GAREKRSRRSGEFRRRGQGLRQLSRRLPRQAITLLQNVRASVAALMLALRCGALAVLLTVVQGGAFAQGDAKRGAYLAKAAGCVGCHTETKKDATPYAGGRALKTPFGV